MHPRIGVLQTPALPLGYHAMPMRMVSTKILLGKGVLPPLRVKGELEELLPEFKDPTSREKWGRSAEYPRFQEPFFQP